MKSRQEIKEYAKQAFAAQRSASILAILLVMLIPVGVSIITVVSYIIPLVTALLAEDLSAVMAAVMGTSFVVDVISIAVTLITVVLLVNVSGTMVKAFCEQPITATEPYTTLNVNFARKLGGMCWLYLWIWIWSLVGVVTLFIPTIIKALSYSMAPFILASNPNVTATNALSLSKRMTDGHKGKIFVMALSFIGWQLLNGITLGILGIFYVNPYMYISFAGLFVELRNQAVTTGAIHSSELDDYQEMDG